MITNEQIIAVLKKRESMMSPEDFQLLIDNVDVIPEEQRQAIIAADEKVEKIDVVILEHEPELTAIEQDRDKLLADYEKEHNKNLTQIVKNIEHDDTANTEKEAEKILQNL